MKLLVLCLLALSVSCSRIETGEVGVRIGFDKQVVMGELQPGSFNQTVVGSVLTFQIKDVGVDVIRLQPIAKDNSTMKEVDATIIYNVNPSSVSEIYATKNKSFHLTSQDGDILLMSNYVHQIAKNAIFKAARNYEALLMNDNRQSMEQEVRAIMSESLKEEKLDTSITISQVLIKVIQPADSIVQSANALVRAKNELLQKQVEVNTASKEAERISILNANKGAIEYMNAMATQKIAEGIAEGKVNTIIVPMDFKGMISVPSH
jgi:hypothetical protein